MKQLARNITLASLRSNEPPRRRARSLWPANPEGTLGRSEAP